jgi:hypothetical protein
MLAHVYLLSTFVRSSIEWALMTRCVIPEAGISPVCLCVLELFVDLLEYWCRKLLHSLEHIHLEDHGLTAVAGASQKLNIQYVFLGLFGWV